MALSLAKAAPLKPEIRLAQALSEFKAVLPSDQKTRLHTYRGQSPPSSTDVMRLTAEIDRDASRNRKSRQCVGTRLTNVLHAVQQFSTVVDIIVGSSQSQIAGAIWGTVKISLQLASTISSYFDQLSTLFMRIGRTSPRYQDFGLLYPESVRLQSALCEYFIVIVRLCKQAVLYLKKLFWSQLSSSILKPFESEFGNFQRDLENLSIDIRDEVSLASKKSQQNDVKEMSRFRVFAKNFSDISTQEIGEARTRKKKKAVSRFLTACSAYDHEISWKQARKRGNTNWICHDEGYKQWKQEKVSSTLWCTGILGSGKTVLSASVVEDLKIASSTAVAFFFCRHDEAKSLKTRTIIGSIARQIFDHIQSDIVDAIGKLEPSGTIDTDQILDYLQGLLPSNSQKYSIIIDGLDECKEKETKLLLQCLKQLLMSKHVFQVFCSSRPDVFRWAYTLLEPQWKVSMSQTSVDIEEYVEDTLVKHLESGSLSIGNSTVILTIKDTLLEKAHGMFLWVAFQIDSICCQKTDDAILTALEDLPKDLPDTFNCILRKLQQSNAADPEFCKKVFDLVAAAQRPLTLEELREAVSVTPGETLWDASKLVNDMLRSLLDSCGSLIVVDEEHLTVHFAHHSIKQHLLSELTDSDMRKYHITIKEADLYLGDVIVTYLTFGIFDRQLVSAKSTMLPQMKDFPSAILKNSLPQSSVARVAVRLLKSKGTPRLDIHSQLKTAAGAVSKEQNQPAHSFLSYAQEYWLFHTKAFRHPKGVGYSLWQHLIDESVKSVELPWAPGKWHEFGYDYMEWMIENEHWALIDRSLVNLAELSPPRLTVMKNLLEFLEKKVADVNAQDINFRAALFVASFMNNRAVVLFSLVKGAEVNAVCGKYGSALQAASRSGHEDIARVLLKKGADIDAVSGEFGTALRTASEIGRKEMARFLLEKGADINAMGGKYGTALQAASYSGHVDIARLLLENGADIDADSEEYGTALRAASYYGHEDMVRLLLENGADIKGGHHGSALRAASVSNHENIIRLLLENGADINAVSGEYGSAMQAASQYGFINTVRLLLKNGADTNVEGGYYGTALLAASCHHHDEITKLLLKNGADVNAESGNWGTALQAASRSDNKEMARLLLRNGANVNAESREYGTALRAASSNGHEEMVRLLLEHGADINVDGGRYGTALRAASASNHEKIIRLLLENGADINAVSGDYGSAMEAASHYGFMETVRLLLKNGADTNVEGGRYGTALQAAAWHNHDGITKLLLENGADVNAESGTWGTALQAASRRDNKEMARLLLRNGANVNAKSGNYGTALGAASSHGREEMVRFLLENGAIADDRTLKDLTYNSYRSTKKLIRDALKSQSSLVRGPTTPSLDEKPSRIPVGMR